MQLMKAKAKSKVPRLVRFQFPRNATAAQAFAMPGELIDADKPKRKRQRRPR
jgi:hypothetical protein